MDRFIRFTLLGIFYIFLLTNIFERFINRVSNTLLTVTGILLILCCSVAFILYLIHQLKNPKT